MKRSLSALALVLAACGHGQSVSPHAAPIAAMSTSGEHVPAAPRDPHARGEWLQTVTHVVSERCDGRESSPSEQTVEIEGVRVQQPCGLVALEFQASAFARFAVDECGETPDTASVECYRRWYGAFISRVLQRYTYADLRSFPVWCEAHSNECDDLRSAEMWFLNSHSSGLHAAYVASLQQPSEPR